VANVVNVNITARDLTRGELTRLRRNFRHLGQDLDRVVTARTRQNFDRLRDSLNHSRRDLQSLRGNIPDDEFFRLDAAMRRAQRTMQRGFGNVGDRAFQNLVRRLRDIDSEFQRINASGQIRVRVDDSAIRRADARLDRWRREMDRNTRVRVRVDPDTNRLGTRVRSALTAPFRQAGRVAGGILSDGIGQGIASGFQGAGPVGIAIFAGIIAGSVSVIGAALSGLLITALGLAFVGVAAISAAKSDEVQRNWATALDKLKGHFEKVGEPLIPVLHEAIHQLEDLADRVAPKFREAMVEAAPAVSEFIDKLFEGFERFGSEAFQPIMDAWNVFSPVFGDVFSDFMQDLGENFADIADLVREHSYEIELALRAVFKVISGIVEVVEFLANAWIYMVRSTNDAFAILINYGLIPLAEAAMNSFELILDGADMAFGWLPGMGEKFDAAKEAFGKWRDDSLDKLRAVGEAAEDANDRLDRINKKRELKADIKSWQAKLAEARRDLKKTSDQKAEAKLKANIADLKAKIASARQQLNSLNGKTAITYIITYSKKYRSVHDIVGKATGGNVGRAATGGARQNLTLVGEQGPELVDLPGGSHVRSNSDSRRLMRNTSDSGGGAVLVLKSSGRRADDLLIEILREAIHQRGGDPVRVLGG
jgi:hypothetical protein